MAGLKKLCEVMVVLESLDAAFGRSAWMGRDYPV